MAKRNRDWRDVLTAYSYAIDGKKVFLGFMAVLFTAVLFIVVAAAYRAVFDIETAGRSPARLFYIGPFGGIQGNILALLNPFGGRITHALFSFGTWFLLFWICTGKGGAIARLTALEYARDELPTLSDGTSMVRARRLDFFLAPVTPLVGVICMWICLVLGGLIASIPYLGPILMVPGYFACLIAGLVMAFLIVVGLLSVGLMMPAMAVNGKGAFDSWTAAYTYVIWGFSRFVVYSLIMGIIGAASIWAVYQLTGLLLGLVESSVNMGHVADDPWILPAGTAAEGFNGVLAAVVYFFKLLVQVVPFAYAFSYYWAASTVIFMLLRKQVDNVEFDEMCEAIPEASAEGERELEITEVQPETGTAAEEDVTAPAEAALEEEPEGLEMGIAEEEPAADTSEPEETEAASGEPEEQEEPEPPQTSRAVEEEEAPAEEEAEPGEEDERVD